MFNERDLWISGFCVPMRSKFLLHAVGTYITQKPCFLFHATRQRTFSPLKPTTALRVAVSFVNVAKIRLYAALIGRSSMTSLYSDFIAFASPSSFRFLESM